jgi:hypothetical protein
MRYEIYARNSCIPYFQPGSGKDKDIVTVLMRRMTVANGSSQLDSFNQSWVNPRTVGYPNVKSC